jgi:uncharacterized transporter YbjL
MQQMRQVRAQSDRLQIGCAVGLAFTGPLAELQIFGINFALFCGNIDAAAATAAAATAAAATPAAATAAAAGRASVYALDAAWLASIRRIPCCA